MTEIELYEEEAEREPTTEEAAAEIAGVMGDLARLRSEAHDLVAGGTEGTGTDLVPTRTTPQTVKRNLAHTRSALAKKQAEIAAKSKELESLMQAEMDRVSEMLEPMKKLVARIEEAILTVNLYLGRDEQIVVLRRGEPCPDTEPITVRQMLLAMDQESALFPEEEGIGYEDVEEFDKWVLESDAHLDQLIPERKGVVALVPRFTGRREDRFRAEEDRQTYFLIRNGECVYRMWTTFNVEDRIVPTAAEFTSLFEQEKWGSGRDAKKHRIPITPGTLEWERAEEKADRLHRHYMRVALILQGLIDRTTVFHPLPPEGVSFLSQADHTLGKVRFVTDMENAIGTGREPFREWQLRLNKELRVGMRIIGSFGWSSGFSRYSYEGGGHSRLIPSGAEYPPSNELLTIEEKRGGGQFVVRYKRREKVWTRYESHVAKRRASCVIEAKDDFVLAFDLVTVEEMRAYLGARLDRHNYAEMFPLLKAAIAAKEAEGKEEQPFREMLTGVLARENGVTVDDASEAVGSLVDWWKLTNRHHRPLIGGEQDQAKAVRMIVAEHARGIAAGKRGVRSEVVEQLRSEFPGALVIGRRRDGKYVVVTPQKGSDVFVTIQDFSAKGKPYEAKEWKLLSKATLARLTILHEGERLAEWDLSRSMQDHLTGPEIASIAARFTFRAKEDQLVAFCYDPSRKAFYGWEFVADAQIDAKHPISGKSEKVEVNEFEIKWSRTTGQAVKTDRSWHSGRPNWTDNIKPWEPSPGNHYSKGVRYELLYHDAELDAHVEAERARYKAHAKAASKLWDRARTAERSIEAQWLAVEEKREYDKFIEDFADPELWEGHRNLLTISYPHRHHGTYRDNPDLFGALVQWLVERGEEFDGLTVSEALAKARSLRFLTPPEAEPIPVDILDLRFDLGDEPDEDDEDENDFLDLDSDA